MLMLMNEAEDAFLVCLNRSMSTGRLSDMLLKAVFGPQLDRGSTDSLNLERPMDTTGTHTHTWHIDSQLDTLTHM